MDMGQSYASCSYKYHLPWTLEPYQDELANVISHISHCKAPKGVFLWWELVQSTWSLLSGLQERLGTASKGLLCWEVASFWRESHITEMIRHVSCKILPESWQMNANYCINLFWVAEHMFHGCRVSNADAVSTERRQLAVGLLRAWRLALRMSQVGLDDILDILDVQWCASILLFIDKKTESLLGYLGCASQFVDHNLISQSTYKWMPHLLYGYQLGCAPQVKRLMMISSHM